MKTYPHMYTFFLSLAIILTIGIGFIVAAKPTPDPPAATSRFACFEVQNFETTVCFDKSDQFFIRELVADPRITEVFPYGAQSQNVIATIEEVATALGD